MAKSLKDGTEVVIRPMAEDDFERSLTFFRALPEVDRKYLRTDVTQPALVRRRVAQLESDRVRRLVALVGDEIVGDGALELEAEGRGWKRHTAELRVIVAHDYQNQGLSRLLCRELYHVAAAAKVEVILAKLMRTQKIARRALEHLGFQLVGREAEASLRAAVALTPVALTPVGDPPGAPVVDLQPVTASTAVDQSHQQGPSRLGGAGDSGGEAVGVHGDLLLVSVILLHRQVGGMVVVDHGLPVPLSHAHHALADLTSGGHFGKGPPAPMHVDTSILGVAEHLQHPAGIGLDPLDLLPIPAPGHPGQLHSLSP